MCTDREKSFLQPHTSSCEKLNSIFKKNKNQWEKGSVNSQ